jgi:hypothetical protein
VRAGALLVLVLALRPAPNAFAGDGGPLAQAAEEVRALEALSELAVSSAAGPAGWVSPDEAAAYCAASPMTVAGLPSRDRDLLYACRAFAGRDPERCRAMPGAFQSRGSKSDCLGSLEHMSLFVDLLAPGSASRRACETGFGIANPKLEPDERVKACAALSVPGDETARCLAFRDAVPRVFDGAHLKDCTDHVAYLLTGRGCEGFHPASDQKVLCSAFAAFRGGACGSDFLCRALRGDAAACEDELALRVSSACARLAPAGARREAAAEASPVLRRQVEATVAWAARLPLLDPAGSEALARLHATMLGRRPLSPEAAVADMLALRGASLDEVLYRAEQLSAAAPDGPEEREVRALRRRAARARERVARGRVAEDPAPRPEAASPLVEKILSRPELRRRFASDLVVRQVCASLSGGGPEPCDVLAGVEGNPESGRRMCRRLYSMSRFSADLISGSAGTAASCAAWCELAPSLPPQDLISRVCGALMTGEYSRACGDIVEWKTPGHGYSPVECEWEMRSVLGISTEEACVGNRRPGSDVCVATARFKKAKAAADAALCGGDPLCRAMMGGDASACAGLDRDLQAKAFPGETPEPAGTRAR